MSSTKEPSKEPGREASRELRVGVIGGGPWGQALARAARRARAHVTLYSRRGESDAGIPVTTDLAELTRARLLVMAVPSTTVRDVARALAPHVDGSYLVVHGIRGLRLPDLETVSDVIRRETPVRRLGALGGPVQVDELLEGRASALVVGSQFPEVVRAVGDALESPGLRVYGTHDLRGLEWASALVGCLSIGVGYVREAGAGPGLVAALLARGVEEAAKLAAAAGAEERTLLGLAGYGDLLASIALERPEVVVGRALARGKALDEARRESPLRVEAVDLVPRIVSFAHERGVRAPVFGTLEALLGGLAPLEALRRFFGEERQR
jgi:glycerol-3-phosphate dehydrogenase (NAD(P)+)